ncbi:MAG: efflux RND transporter periplasmic adaptor subunit [Acidobacteriota bacterium]|nr:efflux RND transporter periplasmic adaptor subunit [Acidobacteriota bacterium]
MNSLCATCALCSIILLSACGRKDTAEAKTASPDIAVTVGVAKVARSNLMRDVVLTAEFKPFQEVEVMAKVAGYVKSIAVDVGDHVKQGQLLATLEIPEMVEDVTKAKASLDRSRAEVGRSQEELRRMQAAHEMNHLSFSRLEQVSKTRPGLVAQQELDDARSRDLVGEAQINAAKSSLAAADEQVKFAQADQTRTNALFAYARVIAPFAGVITKRYADTGSMIQAGTASQTQAMPLVRLSQNSLLRLILPVPESAVPGIRLGEQVDVDVPTLHRKFTGKVARFSGKLQSSTRTMETEVDVPNASLVLVPGMYAEVKLMLERHAGVLAVPLTAVGGPEDKPTLFVVDANQKLQERPVQLGLQTADRAEVKSGLEEGDLIVIGSRSQLKAGEAVTPKLVEMSAPGPA